MLDCRERTPESDGENCLGTREVPVEGRCAPVARREYQVVEGANPCEESGHVVFVRHVDDRALSAIAEPPNRSLHVRSLARADDYRRFRFQRCLSHRETDA